MDHEIIKWIAAIVLGGSSGGGVVSLLLKKAFAQDRQERESLRKKVEILEKEQLAKIADRLEQHIANDKSQEILAKLEFLTGQINKFNDSITRALEQNAKQEAHLAGHDEWLHNLNSSIEELKRRPRR